jgi:hypothetical protein
MNECELILFISTVACALSKCCSTDDLTILSVAFTQLGDTLTTILTKRQLCDNNTNNEKIIDSNDCEKSSDNHE